MRLFGRIEPGKGAWQLTGQPHFLANSGLSPALYLTLGGAVRLDELLAKTAAARMALLVAEKAVVSAWLVELLAELVAAPGAVGFCSEQAVRELMITISRKAYLQDGTVTCGNFT